MRLITFIALCAVVVLASDVIDITTRNWDREVAKTDDPILVEFYRPSCPHCQHLVPAYDAVARSMKEIGIRVGRVNVETDGQLSAPYDIRGVPTLLLFKPKLSKPIPYEGPRSTKAMTDFILEHQPGAAQIQTLSSASKVDSFLASTLPTRCVLFSKKPAPPPLFKQLCYTQREQLSCGFVSETYKGTLEKLREQILPGQTVPLPSLACLRPGADTAELYTGDLKYAPILEHAKGLLSQAASSSPTGTSAQPSQESTSTPSSPSSPSGSAQQPIDIPATTAQTLEPLTDWAVDCLGAPRMCVVFVFPDADSDEQRAREQAWLEALLTRQYGTLGFRWLRTTPAQLAALSGFDAVLGPDPPRAPSAFAINTRRRRVAVGEGFGGVTAAEATAAERWGEPLTRFLDRLVGGDAHFVALPRPKDAEGAKAKDEL